MNAEAGARRNGPGRLSSSPVWIPCGLQLAELERSFMNRTSLCAAVAALFLLAAAPAAMQDTERHVFVTVIGNDGAPVEGLTADHFAIRESGKDRAVLKAEPLRLPMHVAVLVDTSAGNGVPDERFRSAVVDFVERLAGFNEVAVYSFGDRAASVVPFTKDAQQLRTGTLGLFGWAHSRSFLIDAIELALIDLERLAPPRPVIVAISSESPEASRKTAGSVIKRLIGQSTAFHAVSLATGTGTGGAKGLSRDEMASMQQLRGMVAAGEGDRERNRVLDQGTSSTGGGRQRLTSALALGPALTRLSRELSGSYRVTFARPGSDKIKDLQVGIMVEGVTLRATAAPFGTR
jgi:VWFA-related protein